MKRILLLLLVVALAALPSAARAATLFTGTLARNSSVNNFSTNPLDLDILFLDNELLPTNIVRLFDDLVIDPSNVGDTFVATAANDPSFSAAVDRLTDAFPEEFIHVFLAENGTGVPSEEGGGSESSFFSSGSPPVAPNPAVATIDSIAIHIDKFILLPKGTGGDDKEVDFLLTLTIHGTPIPEPSTAWLIAYGLVTFGPLLFFRRRRPLLVKAMAPRRKQ